MAEADKLNIDSIIQRLLEGKSKDLSIFISQVAILARTLDNRSRGCAVEFVFERPSRLQIASSLLQNKPFLLHSCSSVNRFFMCLCKDYTFSPLNRLKKTCFKWSIKPCWICWIFGSNCNSKGKMAQSQINLVKCNYLSSPRCLWSFELEMHYIKMRLCTIGIECINLCSHKIVLVETNCSVFFQSNA